MSWLAEIPLRRRVLVANGALGCVMLLVAGMAPPIHHWTVTAPAKRQFAAGLEEILDKERAALKRKGEFVPFASTAGAAERALPGLRADRVRKDLFAYRASLMPDGGLTLTAWTRQEAVLGSGTPPFAAVYRISPKGEVVSRDDTFSKQ